MSKAGMNITSELQDRTDYRIQVRTDVFPTLQGTGIGDSIPRAKQIGGIACAHVLIAG